MHYLLFYETGEDYASRRAPYREEHLRRAWAASERGELVLGGALAGPMDGAVLLFKGDSPEVAENFAKADPYVTSGAVRRWYVREWTTVAGKDAAAPVRPRPMVRMWRGRAHPERASEYVAHVTGNVFPRIREIRGYRGAQLLRRVIEDGEIEFVVLTFWESMDAVREFAGPDPDHAVVEPQAQAILREYDAFVDHFEMVYTDQGPL
jgi:heme-degrading monooxygenase HmoA/uncharacterized protein YciI